MSAKTKAESLPAPPANKYPDRIIRQPEVTFITGIGPTNQFEQEKEGTFPARFAIGPRSAGWLLSEVMAWVEARAAERRTLPRPLDVTAAKKPAPPVKSVRRASARSYARA